MFLSVFKCGTLTAGHCCMPVTLRPFQLQALEALNNHREVIVLASTGLGKSRIFMEYYKQHFRETPAQVVWIISPLQSLNRQHEANFKKEFGSNALRNVYFLSPESEVVLKVLRQKSFESKGRVLPEFLVIDECHTVFEWGESFRPALRNLLKLAQMSQVKKVLFLSATLIGSFKLSLKSDFPNAKWIEQLAIPEALEIELHNIDYSERLRWLVQFFSAQPACTLVFVGTRGLGEKLGGFLEHVFSHFYYYHAGMSREERLGVEELLSSGIGVQGVVATSAFGMGMDFSILKNVIFFDPPRSVEALIQGIGRVGRSGAQGKAIVLYSEDDLHRYKGQPEFSKLYEIMYESWIEARNPRFAGYRLREILQRALRASPN